ncbi:MAG: helix-turn-helix transcriptional regulator, partial [Cohnella sp.]|nr:helix-turn-helix transcriptional regulator [Cohnella sp.]
MRRLCADSETLGKEFGALSVGLNPALPVALVVGRQFYPENAVYLEKSRIARSFDSLWHTYLSEHTRYIGVVDKHGDHIWFLQPAQEGEEKPDGCFTRFLEGTLELVQEAVRETLGSTVAFTVSGASCAWKDITPRYERLRQLLRLKLSEGVPALITDRADQPEPSEARETQPIAPKAEIMAAHLEADRKEKFDESLEEVKASVLQPNANAEFATEAYYLIALVLYAYVNRHGLHKEIDGCGKLLRLDNHPSMREAFGYLSLIADRLFSRKRADDRERTTGAIDQICRFIHDHLNEDLSLVRLAELHYFNPTYLSRLFKQERGINLSEYIERCRIKKAMDLLKSGDLKVREVAASVG